ncbi:sterol-sensing domain of SREBP cleavage-activation-domain-containing protein [Gymnopilus junonius]|uniref:Sterol regulatory element-binding protein cleavage-activating protein n=1 Tax=Gymnopilus junonius TaxID=109634 RepID=A0A9P5N7Z0_GYMJU|nr:sterol-sensing domain of SREBP cleavage-activation-domain-containing protein [Gymnopilus junonius]
MLQWARTLMQRFFLQLGLHCATHQVRVILISCVVITSLFYPALDLYTSSRDSSQSFLDALISPHTSSLRTERDLVNIWAGQDTLRVHEDPFTRAKCRDALRVERILIQSQLVEDDGALNHQVLRSTLKLERRLQELASGGDSPCLKKPDGQCLIISPLAFWNYEEAALASDLNILDTLGHFKNVSVSGIPITPNMVLAGRGSYEHHVGGSKFDYARFLALTYFFPNSPCSGSSAEHSQWVHTIQDAVIQNAEVTVQVPEATLIALEYDPERTTIKGWSAMSAFLYLAYIAFFAYVCWSVRYMDAVHSRLGVTFTALVEIAVSTITSLSVCALVGFRITMVPWELLPIVIIFVGAENMFNLVDAVGRTSVTLPVKQRIAEGLGRAGTSNTLKVVSYNAILGVIAVFAAGAVRQFCTFAIVVLVAHWSLAHTFFMAVLSIDIARLELEELLRRDTSLIPSAQPLLNDVQSTKQKQPRSGLPKLIHTTQALLKGRAATNVSLLMLLAMAATLYYTTYTASTSTMNSSLPKALGAVSRTKARPTSDAISTAERIWKTLNIAHTQLLHLRIELPTIITFSPDLTSKASEMQASYRSRYTMRTFSFVLWVLTILVLPIAATTSALYGTRSLLEAQRHKPEGDAGSRALEDARALQGQISFSTLPRGFQSDVELIAASKDGRTIVSVGLHNEILVLNADTKKQVTIDAEDAFLRMASTSSRMESTITSVTVDDAGRFFAIGTSTGLIAVWTVEKAAWRVKPLPWLALDNSSAGVTEMCSYQPFNNSILLATYENGVAARWTVGVLPTVAFFTPSRRAPIVIPEDRVLIAFCLDDGTLELVETGDFEPTMLNDCCLKPGNAFDMVWKVHACRAEMNGSMRFIVAAATEAGTVSLWDGLTENTCHFCGQLPMESLAVAFSVDHNIRFSKLYLDDQTRRCACSRTHPQQQRLRRVSSRESLGRRSRSSSTASSQMGSPHISRARLATAFETLASPFPVSGHGVHSRRASEKEARRSTELLTVPFPGTLGAAEDYDISSNGSILGHYNTGSTTPTSTYVSQSVWRNAMLVPLADVTCERGCWDVTSKRFVGVRRKARSQGKPKSTVASDWGPSGLTSATLERWEIWMFDPATALLRSSLLASLSPPSSEAIGRSSTSSLSSPRLPFTRVSPLLVTSSPALAGFGNTIGVFHFHS